MYVYVCIIMCAISLPNGYPNHSKPYCLRSSSSLASTFSPIMILSNSKDSSHL